MKKNKIIETVDVRINEKGQAKVVVLSTRVSDDVNNKAQHVRKNTDGLIKEIFGND